MSAAPFGYDEFWAEAERLDPERFAKARAECAEAKALRKDAERYRWLRDADMDHRNTVEHYASDALDAAIDAAIDAAMKAAP